MKHRIWNAAKIAAILTLFVAQASLFIVIPSLGTDMFMSPDETANATASRAFAQQGDMRVIDPILRDGPWLRPRSFVTQRDAMVPVGFLGLPMVVGALSRVAGEWALVLFVPLLVLATAYPLWRMFRSSGRFAQIAVAAGWLGFPTVILYANRGLYANLPVVCLTTWAVWLMWERRSMARAIAAGLAAGVAIAMRPTEIVWIVPWLAVAWRMRQDRRPHQERLAFSVFVVSLLVPCIIASLVAWKTYGSPFAVGYLLRDTSIATAAAQQSASPPQHVNVWPFGFHPRAIWFNVHSYLLGEWMPWVVLSIISAVVAWKKKESRPWIALGAWTVVVGVMMYGQQIYQDHVGVNVVSTGNSFLRYLLPTAMVVIVAVGFLVAEIARRVEKKRLLRVVLAGGITMLLVVGTQIAFAGDDENILRLTQELERYRAIRSAAFDRFGYTLIVISERSDKIFFPMFRAASPIPPLPQVRELVAQAQAPVTLYAETLDASSTRIWMDAGMSLTPMMQNQQQTLYAVMPINASKP